MQTPEHSVNMNRGPEGHSSKNNLQSRSMANRFDFYSFTGYEYSVSTITFLLVKLLILDILDTIDHDILIDRLQNYTDIQGQVLRWFRSYLSNCYHFIYTGRKLNLNYHQ